MMMVIAIVAKRRTVISTRIVEEGCVIMSGMYTASRVQMVVVLDRSRITSRAIHPIMHYTVDIEIEIPCGTAAHAG